MTKTKIFLPHVSNILWAKKSVQVLITLYRLIMKYTLFGIMAFFTLVKITEVENSAQVSNQHYNIILNENVF